jgi:hypothetical protein
MALTVLGNAIKAKEIDVVVEAPVKDFFARLEEDYLGTELHAWDVADLRPRERGDSVEKRGEAFG